MREAEPGAELAFAAGHLAVIAFVVVTGEMEQAMENQDLDLGGEGMALLDCLLERGGHGDGQVAGERFGGRSRYWAFGGKGENVGCLVFAAKLAVEAANGGVGGQQDGDFALEASCGLGSA